MLPLSVEAFQKDEPKDEPKDDDDATIDYRSDTKTVDYGEVYPGPQRPGSTTHPPIGSKKPARKTPSIGKTQRKFHKKTG